VDFESTTPGSSPGGSSLPLLAQLVEQWTVVPFVIRSIRIERIHSPIAQLVERATVNREVIGSNPIGRDLKHS
jgi:hypothetical protein